MKSFNGKFHEIYDALTIQLSQAPVVHVGEWQAISGLPQDRTIELEDVSFEIPLPSSDAPKIALQILIQPNLPWAEDHFLERVGGEPLNPPPSHEWWPYAQKSNEQHVDAGKRFSHTYPERMWAKQISDYTIHGERREFGDLEDLVQLLMARPGTRQAFLPIWFPSDGATALGSERVPCTIGYHFLARDGKLKIVYYIRSCDFYRHFRDDVYMAGRLCQWVAERVGLVPNKLVMHISSLHIFESEKFKVDQEAREVITKNMFKVR